MTLDVSRVRALCFDIDGTLSDTDDLWVHRLERTLLRVGFSSNQPQTHTFARELVMLLESPANLLYHLLDRLGLDGPLARLYNILAHIRTRPQRTLWEIPGACQMLRMLQPRYPMAVVSARDHDTTHAFLDHFNLQSLFTAVVTAQTCIYTKPFPDPVLKAAQALSVAPEACLMIGDTSVDILAAKAAGAQAVGVLCGFGREHELRRAGADLILPQTSDLTEALLGIPQLTPTAPIPGNRQHLQ